MDHSFSETCASQTQNKQNIAFYNKYKDSNMSIITMHQDGYQSFVIQLYTDSTKQELIQILNKVELEKIELSVKYAKCMTQLVQVKKFTSKLQTKNQDLLTKIQDLQVKNQDLLTKIQDLQAKNQDLQAKNQDLLAKNQDLQARVIKLERICQHLVRQNQDLLSRLPTTKKKQKLHVTLAENKKFK